MCGIAGAISTAGGDVRKFVEAAVREQFVRGPDLQRVVDYAVTNTVSACLGHDRLSIIDLSSAGSQPMSSADAKVHLVFNGAIYNYQEIRSELLAGGMPFRGLSDTEVLLNAYLRWGTDAFARFYGMFAFAILDIDRRKLILCRDRFGVKPLYYWSNGRDLVFASTPTVVARDKGLVANLEYAGRGVRLKYYEDETTISPFHQLASLPPASFVEISLDGSQLNVSMHTYYCLTNSVAQLTERLAGQSDQDCIDELQLLLQSATQIRLRADVTLGISVSGGVDSTAIAALSSVSDVRLRGYSFGAPDDPTSEGPLVELAASKIGMQVRYVAPAQGDDAATLFWKTMRAQGLPFPHTSQLAQFAVFEAARADGAKVLLGGQGGDEAFMGYRKFFLFYLATIVRKRDFSSLPAFALAISALFPAIASKAGLFWGERRRYAPSSAGMGTGLNLPILERSPSPAMTANDDIITRQILDVTRYSLPTLLRYEDRNSMGNSIESRLPFLDHRVVEFGIALPIRQKLRRGFGKYILRKAMQGAVPAQILTNRDKRGFDTRHQEWIDMGIGQTIRNAIEIHRSKLSGLLPSSISAADYFSDRNLGGQPQRFAEATSLIWLADPSMTRPA